MPKYEAELKKYPSVQAKIEKDERCLKKCIQSEEEKNKISILLLKLVNVETENKLGPMFSALRKEIQQSTLSITRKLNYVSDVCETPTCLWNLSTSERFIWRAP